MPPELKAAIWKAFQDAPTKNKAAFDKLSDGKDKELQSRPTPSTTKASSS